MVAAATTDLCTVSHHEERDDVQQEEQEPSAAAAAAATTTPNKKRTSSYTELRMEGPPLYNQGVVHTTTTTTTISDSPDTTTSSNILPTTTIIEPPLLASSTALLIVDVQPQYWSQCPAVRKDFPDFPQRIQHLIRIARQRHVRIIWVYADYKYHHSPWLKQFHRLHKGRIPPEVHFDDKTGWEPFAQPLPHEATIAKNSWSSTSSTKLLGLLRDMHIDTVLVCGLITSVCVQHSAFGVFEVGHRTILVTDACADRGRERHQAALALYGDYMYELKTVEQIDQELKVSAAMIEVSSSSSNEESGTDEDDVVPPSRKRVKRN